MRRHTGRLLACAAAALVALMAPGPATAKPGALDRGFNGDGRVVTVFPQDIAGRSINYVLPYEFAPGRIAMARGLGGRVVIASSKAIVVYLGNGRRDSGFGGGGAVPIGPIEGGRFQIADVAVDSRGRVLVAGTTKPTELLGLPGQAVAGPLPTVATIRRYLPNGQLDPGFGSGGVLSTTLGAPAPTYEGKAYSQAAVAVVGLAVDRQDRLVISGSAVAEVGRCVRSNDRYEASQAIVARLLPSGAPDPTFAGTGTRVFGGLSWLGLPAPTPSRIFSVGARTDPCPSGGGPDNPSVLAAVGADGAPGGGFAAGGFFSRPFTRISDLAVTPAGKLLLLARTIELKGGKWVESAGRAIQLRANGSLDKGFGANGEAQVRLPRRGSISALTTDAKGRVLLAGSVWRKPPRKKRLHVELLLIRATANGETDRDFGRSGRVSTSFGARTNVRATEVLVDDAGRVAVGGKYSGPKTGDAFALARYLGGN